MPGLALDAERRGVGLVAGGVRWFPLITQTARDEWGTQRLERRTSHLEIALVYGRVPAPAETGVTTGTAAPIISIIPEELEPQTSPDPSIATEDHPAGT